MHGDLAVTGNVDADELLDTDPFALLMGMLLDQQVPMEWAFTGPYTLKQRLGLNWVDEGDGGEAADTNDDGVSDPIETTLEWGVRSMGKRVQSLAQAIVDDDDGDAEAVWRDVETADELHRRLIALPGYGQEKTRIFIALLAKRFGVRPKGWEEAAGPFSDDTPRSVADIDSPDTLARVRQWKQARKAAGKTKAD